MCSSVTRDASTCVRFYSVSTSCSIITRAAAAFVNVYKKFHYKLLYGGVVAPNIRQTESFETIYSMLANVHAISRQGHFYQAIIPHKVNLCYELLTIRFPAQCKSVI